MTSHTLDIIVPVWNSPFETRACLAAILANSPGARLIIVDNGSSRETELMLEEFSETLGERGLFIKSERNIGLIPAINMGLARSDSDFAVILRPNVTVGRGWLKALLDVAEKSGAAIVSPQFAGAGAPLLPSLPPGCEFMECFTVSLSALLISGEMRVITGFFNEFLDGGEWCIREYLRRAASKGYRSCVTTRAVMLSGAEPVFGSPERRNEMQRNSRSTYLAAWGVDRDYAVYFGKGVAAADIKDMVMAILDGARRGHRFTLLLYKRQHSDFLHSGWDRLHTGIQLYRIPVLLQKRSLQKKLALLQAGSPDLLLVRGSDGMDFPMFEKAISLAEFISAMECRLARTTEYLSEVVI